MLEWQHNQAHRNSQGESGLCWGFRNGLATVNGSQGQRRRRRRIVNNVKSTA
jgi:hypothetical protein